MASPSCRATSRSATSRRMAAPRGPGCAFLAVRGSARARAQVRAAGGRQRRARGVVGAGAGGRGSRPAVARSWSRRCRTCASTRARSPTASSARPRASLAVAGITGTNGKTTCAYLLAQALEAAGRPAAYMGTIGTGRPQRADRERADHRRRGHRAAHAGATCARDGAAQRGDGSLLARARSGARRRGAVPHRGVHQSHARSSRLSRHHGQLRRRQGAPVHARRPGVARDQRRRRLRPPAGHRSARPRPRWSSPAAATSRTRAPPPASCAPCTSSCRRSGIELEFDSSWGTGALTCPLVGDFNVDNLLTVIAVLLDWDIDARAGHRRRWRACAPRPAAWKLSAARTRRSRWSTTRTRPTRCARRCRRRARIAPGRLVGGVRLRRRSRSGQASAHGRDRGRARRRHRDHRRQSAHRIAAGHRRGYRRGHSGGHAVPHRARSRARDSRGAGRRRRRRRRADRGQGPRGLPDLRHASAAPSATRRWSRPRWPRARAVRHEPHAAGIRAVPAAASCVGADRAYTGVSTDTRTLKPGELFVALRGPRFNANDFVAAAETAGAAGAVVDTPRRPAAARRSWCADTQAALTTLGRGLARAVFDCRSSASPAATARPRSRR